MGKERCEKPQRESDGNVEKKSHKIDFVMARECGWKLVEEMA